MRSYYSLVLPGSSERGTAISADRPIPSSVHSDGSKSAIITTGTPPRRGEVNKFVIGEHNQQVIRIPGDCWHGFKLIGNEQAILLSSPTNVYDYEDPDEERLPPHTDQIPLDWDEQPH